ncbi:MAG: hypothetical protein CM15mP86_06840 [Gammaproteobacteria bacterium]|nr:MAG: hypothetical protein CM15mP86_06840 [Gammaproteobacteria bacterium]
MKSSFEEQRNRLRLSISPFVARLNSLRKCLMPALIAGIPQALAIENAKRLLGDMNLENKENNKPDELSAVKDKESRCTLYVK